MYEGEACGVANSANGGCGDVNDPGDDAFTNINFVEYPAGSKQYYAVVCAQSFAGEEDPNQPGFVFRDLD